MEAQKTELYNFSILDTLPNFTILKNSIQSDFQQRIYNDLILFREDKKGDWLKYVPSVGLGFALVVRNEQIRSAVRPSFSLSTNLVYEAIKDRKEKRRLLETLKIRNELEMNQQIDFVKELYLSYQIRFRAVSYTHLTLPTICSV